MATDNVTVAATNYNYELASADFKPTFAATYLETVDNCHTAIAVVATG